MTDSQLKSASDVLPDDFVEQVKQVLEHLYDFPYLQQHPLTRAITESSDTTEVASQRLRREFIAAIETLNPGSAIPFRAPQARLYNLLHLRYVEGMTVQETASELGISTRQAYRDLRQGEKSVAALLWAQRETDTPAPKEVRARHVSSVQAEMNRLDTHPRPTDVGTLLKNAQKSVGQLAAKNEIDLLMELPVEPITVSTDPAMAQQMLVSTLSQVIQHSLPGQLSVHLSKTPEQVTIVLQYTTEDNPPAISQVQTQLAERLGWDTEQTHHPPNIYTTNLLIPAHGPTILVIDDNEGLVDLLDRYLTGHACRVVAATSGSEGLRLAYKIKPDAIILDVMMPEMDGWEVLQRLRAKSEVPVVICSLFNDPELAQSLGASLFLPKPVRRDDVLLGLRQLEVV